MGLGNVILVQGRQLQVENSAETRALGKVVPKAQPCGQETQESNCFVLFFFFLQRSGRENASKTNLVL